MKTKLLTLAVAFLVLSGCAMLPNMTIVPKSNLLVKDTETKALDSKINNTDFSCKSNYIWTNEGILGFNGVFYDALIKKYSLGEPELLKYDEVKNKFQLMPLSQQQMDKIAEEVGARGNSKALKDNFGVKAKEIALSLVNTFVNKASTVHDQTNFQGEISNLLRSHSVEFKGFIVEKSVNDYGGFHHFATKMKMQVKRENDKDFETYMLKKIPLFIKNIEDYWLNIELSPDGNKIKIGTVLIDLEKKRQKVIWKYKNPIYNVDSYGLCNAGIKTFISPNWDKIGFSIVDYYLKKTGIVKVVDKKCEEANLQFYKLNSK